MTQSKIERKRAELIEKYGDRDLIYIVDEKTGKRVYTLSVSNIIIRNTADLKEVERIIYHTYQKSAPADIIRTCRRRTGERGCAMRGKTVTVIVAASCENGEQCQNCIDCPHFCGVKRDELRDSYVVECGYKPTKKGQ